MADGNNVNDFNASVVNASKVQHWHQFRAGIKDWGNLNNHSTALRESVVQVDTSAIPSNIPAQSAGGSVVAPNIPAQMANYLDALLNHTHGYNDEYSTVCNCNCNCNCNCTRGAL